MVGIWHARELDETFLSIDKKRLIQQGCTIILNKKRSKIYLNSARYWFLPFMSNPYIVVVDTFSFWLKLI